MTSLISLPGSKLVLWELSCCSWQLCQTIGGHDITASCGLWGDAMLCFNGDAMPCCLRAWLCNLFKEMSILCHLWTSSRLKTYFGYMCFKTLVVYFHLFFNVIIMIVDIFWVLTLDHTMFWDSALYLWIHLIFMTTSWGRYHFYFHFSSGNRHWEMKSKVTQTQVLVSRACHRNHCAVCFLTMAPDVFQTCEPFFDLAASPDRPSDFEDKWENLHT